MGNSRSQVLFAAFIGLAASGVALYLNSEPMRSSFAGELLWRLELVTYDFRVANSTLAEPSDDVVIVAIDEMSISHLGVWPWSREYHAKVIRNLKAAGAAVIGLDMILSTVSGAGSLEDAAEKHSLDWEPPLSSADEHLERAIADAGNVTLSVTIAESHIEEEALDASLTQAQFPHWRFEDAAASIGVVDMPQDADGVIRRCRIGRTYQDEPFFTMPVVLAAAHKGMSPEALARQIVTAADARGRFPDGAFLMSYRQGPGRGFRQIPYYRVLRNELSPSDVRGKVVLVGAVARALQDLHNTPMGSQARAEQEAAQTADMPGVEVMANALDTILRQAHVRHAPAPWAGLVCVFLAVLVGLLEVRLRPLWALLAAWLPSQVAVVLLAFVLWQFHRLWMPVIAPAMAATISYVGVMIYLELTSERQRRKMHQSWSQRVSPEVLKVILNNPSMAQVSGKRLNATVLFTDLQGFTTFCAEAPPEVVVKDLNLCLALVTQAVRRHGGTVHKFIGDGVMAVFGDPVEQPDHALRAVRAACEMQQEIGRLRENATEGQWVPKLRVGIHTGPLVAGDIGSKEMLEYTVIGDTVSTASRLEGLNKEYGSSIMLSEETRDAAGDEIPTRPLGTAEIRGRPEPMRVFAVDV